MNFNVFLRLLVIIIIVILIYECGNAAEDYLIISPSTVDLEAGAFYVRAGKMEITIFGSRDSDKADVIAYSYFVNYCCGGTYTGIPQLNIKATIEEGENTGKTTYEKKFPIYLRPGLYIFSYRVSNTLGGDYEIIDMGGIKYLSVTEAPIPISIENVTRGAIVGSDTFLLEGITIPGSTEKYWGNFKWNPNTLSFELIDAGVAEVSNSN